MRQPIRSSGARCGVGLVELLFAVTIVAVLLLGALAVMQKQSQGLRRLSRVTANTTRAQEMLLALEQELSFARAYTPTAFIVTDAGLEVSLSTTFAFPDKGMLLVNRGAANEERISYERLDLIRGAFMDVTRGVQCTEERHHGTGSPVQWAFHAEPIENQETPAASQYDGLSIGPSRPIYFRGDGTGLSFQLPTDPNGGTNYMRDGDVTWGATIYGQPSLNAHSVIYFEPTRSVTEISLGADINRDADLEDTFDVGRLVRRTWNAADGLAGHQEHALCPSVLLQERCNWGGDMDADGFDDPMFLWDPEIRRLLVRIFLLDVFSEGQAATRSIESTIYLRNAL